MFCSIWSDFFGLFSLSPVTRQNTYFLFGVAAVILLILLVTRVKIK